MKNSALAENIGDFYVYSILFSDENFACFFSIISVVISFWNY